MTSILGKPNDSEVVLAASKQRFRPSQTPWIEIEPERNRVRVRCGGGLDAGTASQLREDCAGLIDRGFDWVILDLSQTTAITPAAVSAIAGIDRRARVVGCRFTVAPGRGSAAAALRQAGLLGQLQLEGVAETFLDWSR
ncbi:MAG: STAS domain-containing protein [Solirubrobacteraceae bacterium]